MFEEMANQLVESLTGMTVDQIKQQMLVVQQRVTDTIDAFNGNFAAIQTRLMAQEQAILSIATTMVKRLDGSKTGLLSAQLAKLPTEEQMKAAHKTTSSILADRLEMVLDRLEMLHTTGNMLLAVQANTLTHIAQISHKLGIDLTPDLIEQLTKAATGGRASTFTIPPAEPIYPETMETGFDGIGLDVPAPSNPGDTPHESKAGDVFHGSSEHSAD